MLEHVSKNHQVLDGSRLEMTGHPSESHFRFSGFSKHGGIIMGDFQVPDDVILNHRFHLNVWHSQGPESPDKDPFAQYFHTEDPFNPLTLLTLRSLEHDVASFAIASDRFGKVIIAKFLEAAFHYSQNKKLEEVPYKDLHFPSDLHWITGLMEENEVPLERFSQVMFGDSKQAHYFAGHSLDPHWVLKLTRGYYHSVYWYKCEFDYYTAGEKRPRGGSEQSYEAFSTCEEHESESYSLWEQEIAAKREQARIKKFEMGYQFARALTLQRLADSASFL